MARKKVTNKQPTIQAWLNIQREQLDEDLEGAAQQIQEIDAQRLRMQGAQQFAEILQQFLLSKKSGIIKKQGKDK